MLCNIFIFNKLKIYQNEISKRPPFFIFQKRIKRSTMKLRRLSIHRICIEKGHQNKVEFSPVKLWLEEVCQNNVNFLPTEITSSKARQNDVEFLPIFFSTYRSNIDIKSMLIRRDVSVGNSTIHSSSSSY